MNELFTKEFDSDSNDDEYIPSKKELEQSNEEMKNKKKENIKVNKSKVDAIWEKLKHLRYSNNDNINLKNENSNNNNKYSNQEIEIIKTTNEILKSIDKVNELKDYLIKKYINPSSLNYDKDYKEFLNKLINYEFDIITLNNILSDIKNKNNNLSKFQEELYNENKSNQQNLINYNLSSSYSLLNRPPFINATNPYGRLFSEKNKIK
jgi:hypothetical protein